MDLINYQIRLVRSQPSSSQFVHTFKTSHEVYEKYQTKIHGDSLDRCCESQFKRFLCNSPLQVLQYYVYILHMIKEEGMCI